MYFFIPATPVRPRTEMSDYTLETHLNREGCIQALTMPVSDCQANQASSRNKIPRTLRRRTSQSFFSLATPLSADCLSFTPLLLGAHVLGSISKKPCTLWRERIVVVGPVNLWEPEGLRV